MPVKRNGQRQRRRNAEWAAGARGGEINPGCQIRAKRGSLRLPHPAMLHSMCPGASTAIIELYRRLVGAFLDGHSARILVCARLRHVAGTQAGQQKVYEYEALSGYPGGCLYCWLILFCQSLQTILRIILDTTLICHAMNTLRLRFWSFGIFYCF